MFSNRRSCCTAAILAVALIATAQAFQSFQPSTHSHANARLHPTTVRSHSFRLQAQLGRSSQNSSHRHHQCNRKGQSSSTMLFADSASLNDDLEEKEYMLWEEMALTFHPNLDENDFEQMKGFVNTVTLLRVGLPAAFIASSACLSYPTVSLELASLINDSGVFSVVAQDASQYIQNILTTSGLMFSILLGQTYYFMYQQQEAIYLALFEEVATTKSLMEQVGLVSRGRQQLYTAIMSSIQEYVNEDLSKFNDIEPAEMISARPMDDPLEEVLYLTSVGEPSMVYQTVKSLRQARAYRLGALQRKLPEIQMILLWTLATITLFTFPLLGAGSQTIGGIGILNVQAWYLGFLVFGISITMGIVNELRTPSRVGAYNARTVLHLLVEGLKDEVEMRMNGSISPPTLEMEPTVDNDGFILSPSAAAAMPDGIVDGRTTIRNSALLEAVPEAENVLTAFENAKIVDNVDGTFAETAEKQIAATKPPKRRGFRERLFGKNKRD